VVHFPPVTVTSPDFETRIVWSRDSFEVLPSPFFTSGRNPDHILRISSALGLRPKYLAMCSNRKRLSVFIE
jgi:hypothetical protein